MRITDRDTINAILQRQGEPPLPAPPPKPEKKPGRKPGGKRLETLVVSSQQGVVLTKMPSAARWIGRKTIAVKGPCDFFGMYLATREFLIFDAKECELATRFPAGNPDHVRPHQIEELTRYGRNGAISGLLILRTTTDDLHWLPWEMLVDCPPSYRWEEIPHVGSAKVAIDWDRVRQVARVAEQRAAYEAHQKALRKER
jgi:penicillin-binding protein-related factor A (putative recombinase)